MKKMKPKVAWLKQLKKGIVVAVEKTVLSSVAFSLVFSMCSLQFLFLGGE